VSLPNITSTVTYGKSDTHAYMDDDPAILAADFGVDSQYIVCSKQLATDIYAKNASYDSLQLKRGLKDGWLVLIINPDLYESLSNPLAAIRAIKSDATIDEGWYRLMIIPEWGSRR
jgi:hypothetical protein